MAATQLIPTPVEKLRPVGGDLGDGEKRNSGKHLADYGADIIGVARWFLTKGSFENHCVLWVKGGRIGERPNIHYHIFVALEADVMPFVGSSPRPVVIV